MIFAVCMNRIIWDSVTPVSYMVVSLKHCVDSTPKLIQILRYCCAISSRCHQRRTSWWFHFCYNFKIMVPIKCLWHLGFKCSVEVTSLFDDFAVKSSLSERWAEGKHLSAEHCSGSCREDRRSFIHSNVLPICFSMFSFKRYMDNLSWHFLVCESCFSVCRNKVDFSMNMWMEEALRV